MACHIAPTRRQLPPNQVLGASTRRSQAHRADGSVGGAGTCSQSAMESRAAFSMAVASRGDDTCIQW